MKSFMIVMALVLIPSLALAGNSFPWQNTYEGIGGGMDMEVAKSLSIKRAHSAAAVNGCANPYNKTPGVQIGQVEPPPECQCVDSVCICTDKLTLYCQEK